MIATALFSDATAIREAGEVVLYGAGSVGRDVYRVLTDAGIRVLCILDRQANGQDFLGVPVQSVEACPVEPDRRSVVPLVVSIFNRGVDIPALALKLRSAGFCKIVSFVDLHSAFPEALGDRFWLTSRRHLLSHQGEIADAERLWSDDASRALYGSLIALRHHGEYSAKLNPLADDTQYFPSDVPGWLRGTPLRFVDCGAYRGDTLELMLASERHAEASAHFEPDIRNFAALARLARARRRDLRGAAVLWPCAVGDHSAAVPFNDGRDEASGVSADGASRVTAVALDDVLVGWAPSFIKMDIEGSEVEALQGARQLIVESRPSLAVCVYHRPDHLWRIPLLLASWGELAGYRYYLRAHGFNGFDIVLYASPTPERCDRD